MIHRAAGPLLVLTLVFAPQASAATVTPSTTRASLSGTGAELSGYSALPAVSEDGRWVAFDSYAQNVVPGSQVPRDVYLRDTREGAVLRVAKGVDGKVGNAASAGPSISADGRYVAFISLATNLAGGTTNSSSDVYVYDRSNQRLRRLSTSLTGGDGSGASTEPEISPDGSHVVFQSAANDLVSGDTARTDIFVADVTTGALRRVTTKSGGAAPNGDSDFPDVSDGGRFVAFRSAASDLVGDDHNTKADDFVRDMQTGAIQRVSVTPSGGEADGDSNYPEITADGCLVAFVSSATNLVAGGGTPAGTKAYVRDRCRGNTEVASLTNAGANATVVARPPAISDDGCSVAFVTTGTLVPPPGVSAAVLRDRCQGLVTRLDVATTGEGGNSGVDYLRLSPGSGRYAAFDSGAANLVQGDTNKTFDAFVRDRATATPPIADFVVKVEDRRVTLDASASRDPDHGIASIAASYGDGSPAETGAVTAHDYSRGGTYTVTLTVTDLDGLTTVANRPVTVADAPSPTPPGGGGLTPGSSTTTPGAGGGSSSASSSSSSSPPSSLRLSGASVTKSRFAVVKPGGRAGGARGAYLRLTASDAGTLSLSFERTVRGRRSGGRCSATAKRGSGCTLHRPAGTTRATLAAGANRIALTGRVAGRPLAAGRYRLRARAQSDDGRASNAITVTITITKR